MNGEHEWVDLIGNYKYPESAPSPARLNELIKWCKLVFNFYNPRIEDYICDPNIPLNAVPFRQATFQRPAPQYNRYQPR